MVATSGGMSVDNYALCDGRMDKKIGEGRVLRSAPKGTAGRMGRKQEVERAKRQVGRMGRHVKLGERGQNVLRGFMSR